MAAESIAHPASLTRGGPVHQHSVCSHSKGDRVAGRGYGLLRKLTNGDRLPSVSVIVWIFIAISGELSLTALLRSETGGYVTVAAGLIGDETHIARMVPGRHSKSARSVKGRSRQSEKGTDARLDRDIGRAREPDEIGASYRSCWSSALEPAPASS